MDWVDATGFLKADTLIRAYAYPGGASVQFQTERGTISLAVSAPDGGDVGAATLHDLLTRAAQVLETEALIAVEAQRASNIARTPPGLTPTPMNGEVAQAIVDGLPSIEADDIVQIQMLDGPTGNVIATFDTCACPDQEKHAAWCWRQRTEVGAAHTEDESQ